MKFLYDVTCNRVNRPRKETNFQDYPTFSLAFLVDLPYIWHSIYASAFRHVLNILQVFEPGNSTNADNTTPGSQQEAQRINDILKDVKVPLGGDLLGRERVTGARKTRPRLGCNLPSERFESIVENVALWHCKRSFLEVSGIFKV